ncbi:MAG: helix-turn-helix domain-containing protein [Bacteroidales bacterium]|nr:helix-turn-helix domain-containing protein [Bacteroidales bacterium]
MSRIDIVRLRKSEGISQKKLADMLDIKPSFLSAIENGRSRMPDDKIEKLKSLFGTQTVERFLTEEREELSVPPHTHINDEGDALTQLLNHFHKLAHQKSDDGRAKERNLAERIDTLSLRNDRLSARLDDLREEVDRLRDENLRLKELLILNGIPYSL